MVKGEKQSRFTTAVSIPFIGSNLFKSGIVFAVLAKQGLFQSPLSGQICLNEAAELCEIDVVEFQSPLSGQICLNAEKGVKPLTFKEAFQSP